MSEIQKSPSGRVRRQPVGVRNRLTLKGTDPAYVYRIVADTSDNIARLQERGYEHVLADKVTVGDRRVNQPVGQGEYATQSLGAGVQGYVMRIKKEWYEEDQALKRSEVKKTQDTIKRVDKKDGDYGRIKIGSEAD